MAQTFAFSPARVAHLLNRISEAMGAQPEEHEKFKRWAEQTLRRAMVSARSGPESLRWHVGALRQELAELQHDLGVAITITGRAELQRVCRREWLQNVVQWLEDDLEASSPLLAA